MSLNSEDYWRKREEEQRKQDIKDLKEYRKHLEGIYKRTLADVSSQIRAFYNQYAQKTGMTYAEAMKKADKLDIEAFAEKAKQYVKDKDFSKKANEEMRLYNMTMKANRLELLKAQIGLELCSTADEIDKFMKEELRGQTLEEIERQAGILGQSLVNNKEFANALINASFHNATFSDRIWVNQSALRNNLDSILKNALIQGRNPRDFIPDLRKIFDVSRYQAERLLRTELARVQTEAQMQSYKRNGFAQYKFMALGSACEICAAINGDVFDVEDAEPGLNMPPMHPNCMCSTAPYEDTSDFDNWLNGIDEHGLTWEKWKKVKPTEMYRRKDYTHRKTAGNGGKMIDKALYNRITKPAIKAGADIRFADEQWRKHLQKEKASAVTIGNIIIFNDDATVSDVLEEVHHFYQNKKGMNNHLSAKERTILNEIDAKQYLLSSAKKYKIPLEEIELTKRQLASYMKEMEELKKAGEWHEDS